MAASSSSTTRVDMARQARFAFEFCAKESCGKCTPCRIGSTRGAETVDKIIAGRDRQKNVQLLRDLCEVMTDGSLCALGGLTPLPVLSALDHFSEDFAKAPRARRRGIGDQPMALMQELDTGTPIRTGAATVTLTIDGRKVSVPPGTSVMAAAALIDNPIPKLCATDNLEAFGSCRLCLVEIEGRKGTPASCTTPAEEGMVVHTQTPRLERLRRGVMELYISDHPLDCLTSSANGDCELQTQAAIVGLRDVRYGYDGANHLKAPIDASNPYFTFDPSEMHRLLALRARLRGSAGNVCADDPGPRLRFESVDRRRRFPVVRMRLLRRLRAGLPDRDAERKVGDRNGNARAHGRHDLRLLRRRLLLQGGAEGRRGRAHGPPQGRQGQ